ncbi:MAG: Inosine-5'-monophosphate dehydrogenase [Candidatus Methanofastidiosum methylothiophilum]|uniref:Inosine-5'-monophosphate dehydrogenase n=1 Tax=Candidatus Methanofastidiosum methylothiophilum TaxID=1705564 RepID=A0A150J5I7_9EURY|nr:MAG: Inosine-5'-monophosphate dehydrogenase [Candidatus Methanofastidiosum methylthiophilus]NMC77535.1 CBS domain-containing protein [Candidatus Methanofastidiosa archaeon]
MIDLGDVKKLRKKFGITQNELAIKAGVTQAYIAKLENKQIDPKLSTFNKILNALEELRARMKKIEEVMVSPVIFVGPKDKVTEAITIMAKYNISQLPVLSNGTPVGSLSEKSVVKKLGIGKICESPDLTVYEIMDESFPVISKEQSFVEVYTLLKENQAVLIEEKGKVVGIITRADILDKI